MGISTKFNSKRTIKFKYALIMNDDNEIFGCFFKIGFDPEKSEQEFKGISNTFKTYIWGENGISDTLKKLKHKDYGNDLKLILFEFNVKPTLIELEKLKEIGSYRKSEKSIGIPIVVNDKNFFSQTEEGRYSFLKQSILQKLELLSEVVKKKKLDTKMDLLKADLVKLLS
jgi:hypothetical protein